MAAAAMVFAGCEEKQEGGDDGAAATLTVAPASIDAGATAGSYTLTVTSNTAWTATVEDAAAHGWCVIINGARGSENGSITLQTAQNTVVEERYATITVAAGTLTRQVTVTQAAAAPVLEVDKTTIPAAIAAATYSIGVTSNLTWAAAVNSGATWCTLANANATGNGTVTVQVAENPTIETRAATVTVTSGTLTRQVAVTQSSAAPALAVDKTTIPAAIAAATYSIGVTSNSTWTATVNSGATWCTVSPASGSGDGTVNVSVTANSIMASRSATVTFTSGTLTHTTTVTQAAGDPTLSIDNTTIAAAKTAVSYPVAVTSNSTWTAAVNAAATW